MNRKWILGAGLAVLVAVAAPALAQDDAAQDDLEMGWITAVRVKTVLLEKGGELAIPIEVTMDGTTAILTGEVESKPAQELAAEVALSVEGVSDVVNRLTVADEKPLSQRSYEDVKAHQSQELADARLESSIKLALFKEIGIRARHLEVEASSGAVSIRGRLPSQSRKDIALETVRSREDVTTVIDLIEVGD